MRQQLLEWLQRLQSRAMLLAREARQDLRPLLRAAWDLLRRVLRTALEIALALIILFEEWGWRPLADLLGRLARWRPWAAIESVIMRLPPYAALVVFVLPTTLLLPLKLLALLLIAKGQVIAAGLLFLAAKVVATALIARLFMLTQPALMQIGWFAWCYETFMPWKDALTARVRASWAWRVGRVVKERAKRAVSAEARRWQPAIAALKPVVAAAIEKVRAQGRRVFALIKARWSTLRSNLRALPSFM
jgi:hypothetical protein